MKTTHRCRDGGGRRRRARGAERRSASRPRGRRRTRPSRGAKLPPLPADIKDAEAVEHRRQVRRAAVRLHRRAGPERRLRRRDRALVRALRVRQGATASRSPASPTPAREPLLTTGRVDMVISTFTYTADRDTRIDFSRAYYKATGRLLVKNNSPIQQLSRHRRQDGRDDERLDLRPLDEELLQGHEAARHGQLHERAARVQPGPRGRAHVGRHGARRHRRDRSAARS